MGAEYPSAAALYEAPKSCVTRFQTVGCALGIPDPWHGRSNGFGKILAERMGSIRRSLRPAHRGHHGIWPLLVSLPADRAWKADELYDGASVFPNHFELTVLFGAFAAFFAMLIMMDCHARIIRFSTGNDSARATNDGFFLVIEARDPRFTENEARQLLEKSGGTCHHYSTTIEICCAVSFSFFCCSESPSLRSSDSADRRALAHRSRFFRTWCAR